MNNITYFRKKFNQILVFLIIISVANIKIIMRLTNEARQLKNKRSDEYIQKE